MVEVTEPSTFRLSKKSLDELKSEAKHKGVSLNSLINQIIREHIEWHSSAASAGFIPVRRMLIKDLLEPLDEKQIDDLAHHAIKNLVGTAMLVIVKKHDAESAIELLERWMRISGLSHHVEVKDDGKTYVIQHDMGRKWSYYLARLFEEVAYELKMIRPDIKVADGALYVMLKDTHSSHL
jgi:hypothetical protein